MRQVALRKSTQSKRVGKTDASPALTTRERILQVALQLLNEGGRDALTTRAVAEAAGVQPPALYRLFKDKRGLLRALGEHGYALYFSEKRIASSNEDLVDFLRDGWQRHVQFGLSNPELYLLMYADPHPDAADEANRHAHAGLRTHMRAIAAKGLLKVAEDHATAMFHAAACGVVLSLLAVAENSRDMSVSTLACDAIITSILLETSVNSPPVHVPATAIALRAQLAAQPDIDDFTAAEKALLSEWLTRISSWK